MKALPVFLLISYASVANPTFFEHPNILISFEEPTLPSGPFSNLDIEQIKLESPQNEIWYTGGLVGYFTVEWLAPVWSTPFVQEIFQDEGQYREAQIPYYQQYLNTTLPHQFPTDELPTGNDVPPGENLIEEVVPSPDSTTVGQQPTPSGDTADPVSVPEPSTFALLAGALTAWGDLRSRRAHAG